MDLPRNIHAQAKILVVVGPIYAVRMKKTDIEDLVGRVSGDALIHTF
jgi:hypothetical protein